MYRKQIFGSNIELPSLPGVPSDCEKALSLLMKEIDLEFVRNNESLLQEITRLQSLCQTQQAELKKAQSALLSSQEAQKFYTDGEDQRDILLSELEKLKEKNSSLKKTNSFLQSKAERSTKCEYELEKVKRNLQSKENENTLLMNRLMKLDDKYRSLQNNYEKLVSSSTVKQSKKIEDDKHGTMSLVKDLIMNNTEEYLKEENKRFEEFQLRLNKQISDLENSLSNEEIL